MLSETVMRNHTKCVIIPMALNVVLLAGGIVFALSTVQFIALAGYLGFALLHFWAMLSVDFSDEIDRPQIASAITLVMMIFATIGVFFVALIGLSFI